MSLPPTTLDQELLPECMECWKVVRIASDGKPCDYCWDHFIEYVHNGDWDDFDIVFK